MTGISNLQNPSETVATKSVKEVAKMTSGERGKSVTVVCATKATKTYIPPMFIYRQKRMVDVLIKKNLPAGAVGHCTKSGWTKEKSFLKWLMHFLKIAKPSSEEKHLIILDGPNSHQTLAAVEYAREHGIELLTLPSHSVP